MYKTTPPPPDLYKFPLLCLNASVIVNPFLISSSASASASIIAGRISRTFETRFCGIQTATGSGGGERKMRSPFGGGGGLVMILNEEDGV